LHRLGIIVNPMSGRDVRRVAARAGTSTHVDKQHLVARLVLAALEQGVDEVYLANEPFRISERAIETLPQKHKVRLIDIPLTHGNDDTSRMVEVMWQAGCRTFVVLGGDGTSRIVARTRTDATILPMSTGTNNVFPFMVEATVAGTAAGLIATETLAATDACRPCKRIHVVTPHAADVALVDAVLLTDDALGNLLPFEPAKIQTLVFAVADPASIGMSPIGGYLSPCYQEDEFGLMVRTGKNAAQFIRAPISAGLYGDFAVTEVRRLALDEWVSLPGPGIMALDGDRTLQLDAGAEFSVCVRRDGPRVIDPRAVIRRAVAAGVFQSRHT
jgi:hypothetical protein